MLLCGMKELEVTPLLGMSMPGYLKDRRSTGIKDSIFVKAIILDDSKKRIAIISIDMVHVEEKIALEISRKVFELTGIPMENIMISATHNHTGPPVANTVACESDDDYVAYMISKASDSVLLASKSLRPAKIGFGAGIETEISFNRRYLMKDGSIMTNPGVGNPLVEMSAGPIDPYVTVMRIDDIEGNPIGIITNFACHPDTVGGTEYSSDYPGELSRRLKQFYGCGLVSMFLIGACGDINHVDVTGKTLKQPRHYSWMGRVLAGEVIKTREKIKTDDKYGISIIQDVINVRTRMPDEQEISDARLILKSHGQNFREILFADEIIACSTLEPEPVEIRIQIIRIGELAVIGLPGEIFTEFGLSIRKSSPFLYNMISTSTNGRNGYIATSEAYPQGGYETRITRYNRLEIGTGNRIVEKTIKLLKEINNEGINQ